MHIVLDYRPALRQSTGVGTYIRNLASALVELYPDDRHTLFSASWKDRLEAADLPPVAAIADWRIPVRVLDRAWHRWQWPPVERLVGAADIVHSPSPMLMPSRRARTIITVHDCYFLRHPEDVFGPVQRDYVPLARRAAQAADAVIAVSQTTAAEVRELLHVADDKICVTPLGVADAFTAADADAARPVLAKHGVDGDFLLFVGRREPRKDLGTLLAAFDELLPEHPGLLLVLVGPDAPGWPETWSTATERVRRNTRVVPHLDASRLPSLFAAATIVVMPSRWEGFGLIGLEAMAAGTPVVAAEVGALPEVLGDAALFSGAADAGALAEQCRRLLRDPDLAARHSARGRDHAGGYRWQETARRTHALYERLVS